MKKLSHSFTVHQADTSKSVDTFLNIQKRREEVIFKSSSTAENANLAFVKGIGLSSDLNVSVNDRSNSLPENREIDQFNVLIFTGASSFTSNTEGVLITDIFTEELSTQSATPLFLKHTLKTELESDEYYSNIKILDKNFRPLDISDSRIDTDGIVYNNLANSFDFDTGLFTLFYIQYDVVDGSGNIVSHREILNNTPVFRPATYEDLDEDNNIPTDAKVYLVEEDFTGLFTITLPVAAKYASKPADSARLTIIPPDDIGPENPWFSSVVNGKLIATVQTTASNTSVLKYYIPEFSAQTFNPIEPFKLITGEVGTRVDTRIVKTVKDTIVVDEDESLYPTMYVYRKDGTLKFAITENPDLWDTDDFESEGFESIDHRGGFLVLPTGLEITDTDTIELDYYYTEENYEYKLFNLNPLYTTGLLDETLVLFLKPEPVGQTINKGLFYLVVNEDGQVIDTDYNEDNQEGLLASGQNLPDLVESGQLWYGVTDFPSWADSDSVDFITEFSVEGNPNEDSFLVLGEVFVREHTAPNKLNLFDIRVRGGGIKTDRLAEAKALEPEVAWIWDGAQWDGLTYPGSATYFIEIPCEVLEEAGGSLTPENVRETVYRHTAAGVYPVIHKYNEYEPTVSGIAYSNLGIEVSLTEVPDATRFDVYKATTLDGPWSILVSDLVPNSTNTYTLSIFSPDSFYLLFVGKNGSEGTINFGGPINTPVAHQRSTKIIYVTGH